jgi:hypothetical protein
MGEAKVRGDQVRRSKCGKRGEARETAREREASKALMSKEKTCEKRKQERLLPEWLSQTSPWSALAGKKGSMRSDKKREEFDKSEFEASVKRV